MLTDVQLVVWLGLAVASTDRLPASRDAFPLSRTSVVCPGARVTLRLPETELSRTLCRSSVGLVSSTSTPAEHCADVTSAWIASTPVWTLWVSGVATTETKRALPPSLTRDRPSELGSGKIWLVIARSPPSANTSTDDLST